MSEIRAEVDVTLVLSFEPEAIRQHFDGDPDDPTVGLTDDQLREIGHWALGVDPLYRLFHELLVEGCSEIAPRTSSIAGN